MNRSYNHIKRFANKIEVGSKRLRARVIGVSATADSGGQEVAVIRISYTRSESGLRTRQALPPLRPSSAFLKRKY